MSKRKPVPKKPLPTMDALLGGDLSASVNKNVRKDENTQADKAENIRNEQSREKVKVAFYIDAGVAQRFDYAQVRLKSLTGKKGHQVSRSAIIETALSLLLDDLEEHGVDSLLVKHI